VKYAFIKTQEAVHKVTRLCEVLGVSSSGYYDWRIRKPSARAQANEELLDKIKHIYTRHKGRYGSPRIHATLKRAGDTASRGRIERLMHKNGIVAHRSKRHKRTYQQREQQKAMPNRLNRQFQAARPNEKWVSDITFIPTVAGYVYLATVLDLYSRAIIGWSMSERINGQLVMDALNMAIEQRGAPEDVLVHSDQGSQYTAQAYREWLHRYNMVCSMSRKGDCFDNAVAESFFRTLKEELVKEHRFKTRQEAKQAIFEYIEIYYNRQRLHSYLNYTTPFEYETMQSVA
jgi:transposase InsO family protein